MALILVYWCCWCCILYYDNSDCRACGSRNVRPAHSCPWWNEDRTTCRSLLTDKSCFCFSCRNRCNLLQTRISPDLSMPLTTYRCFSSKHQRWRSKSRFFIKISTLIALFSHYSTLIWAIFADWVRRLERTCDY